MRVRLFQDESALASAAAAQAAGAIRRAIAAKGTARLLAASGASQVKFLEALAAEPAVQWGDVALFQLHEYVGLEATHPASTRKFLFDHLIGPVRVGRYHLLDAAHDPERAGREAGRDLAGAPIDVAVIDLGEIGQVAGNAPPADFSTEKPYLIARLDESCRRERARSAGFPTVADVPERVITISMRQLFSAAMIVGVVPGAAKAEAVKRSCEGSRSAWLPASLLQTHPDATLFLDAHSAALLANPPPAE